MKLLLCASAFALISSSAFADTYVRGYMRSNGTYVQPHFRSDSNNTVLDNYSTRGNVNPYTGREGTVNPYRYRGLSGDDN